MKEAQVQVKGCKVSLLQRPVEGPIQPSERMQYERFKPIINDPCFRQN